jgi:dTDP-6-deoxy-L-talose 4-dehydrogenase (NAD+)
MSGGEQLRDYLTVEQVAKYLCALAYCEKNIGMVNVSSGKPISIRALIENWIQELSSQINLNLGYYPYPDYEPMAFWGNSAKLEEIMTNRSI